MKNSLFSCVFGSRVVVITLLFVMSLLSGCAINLPEPGDPRFSPVAPISQQPGLQSTGSIFASGAGVALWEDQRARRIGDIVTILLEEKTISRKSSKTGISKSDTNEMEVSALLGTTPSMTLPGMFNTDSPLSLNSSTSNERDFEGEADADRSNQLSGNISVTVVDVLTNGNLVVRGEKWMTFSEGDEFIRIEGMVRQSDVNPDNTVLSTRLADARITYSGRGDLTNAQRKGWVSRVFSHPYWPF